MNPSLHVTFPMPFLLRVKCIYSRAFDVIAVQEVVSGLSFRNTRQETDVLLRHFKTYSVADFVNGLVQLRTSQRVNTLIIACGNKIAQKSVPRNFVESYIMH